MRKMLTSKAEKDLNEILYNGGIVSDSTIISMTINIDTLTSNNDLVNFSQDLTSVYVDLEKFFRKKISIQVSGTTQTKDIVFYLPTYCDFTIENVSHKAITLSFKNPTFTLIFINNDLNTNIFSMSNTIPSGKIWTGFVDGRLSYSDSDTI